MAAVWKIIYSLAGADRWSVAAWELECHFRAMLDWQVGMSRLVRKPCAECEIATVRGVGVEGHVIGGTGVAMCACAEPGPTRWWMSER